MEKFFEWFDSKSLNQQLWIMFIPVITIILAFIVMYFFGVVSIHLEEFE